MGTAAGRGDLVNVDSSFPLESRWRESTAGDGIDLALRKQWRCVLLVAATLLLTAQSAC